MPSRRAAQNQPTLVPIAGHRDRKPFTLDREVITIGRARGADLCLEANEISTLHCVIYRTAEGYRIRDCNSRCGTRINGQSVKTGLLRDADVVNLGPFSFEFHVSSALFPADGAKLEPGKVEHWQASRRRLAELALKLRKRLLNQSPREDEWDQKGHLLKEKIRCYDQRLSELEGAEEELSQERRQLAEETEKHKQYVQSVEKQLAERMAQADKDIHEGWQEFQKRCQAEEDARGMGQAAPTASSDAPANGTAARPDPAAEAQQRLRETAEAQQRLRELEEQYTRRHEQLQRVQREFNTMKEQWVKDQTQVTASLDEQHASLAQKKTELMRMMGELKKMQEDLKNHARPDVRALQNELARLQLDNAELRRRPSTEDTQALLDENEQLRTMIRQLEEKAVPNLSADVAAQFDDLRAEVDLLREELGSKDKALNELSSGAGEDAALRAENDLLKKMIDEQTRAAEEQAAKRPQSESDLETYETELNEFRRQLESDRSKLNKEVETLRERNKELDEAIREMEMEMSKERAELARERMRLERVREEVKADSERLQREMQVRDSMAGVQKLREEMSGKEKPLNDRLRSMRNKLTDGQPSGS
jgi:pSer/pThr/pTyr-binding forkhead associated (FHA) protein